MNDTKEVLALLEESVGRFESLMASYVKETDFAIKRLEKEKQMLEMQLEKQLEERNMLQDACKTMIKKVNSVVSSMESVCNKEGVA